MNENTLYVWLATIILGSLSTRVFETQTATGSELFCLLTCLYTITFTLLSIYFLVRDEKYIKIWETPLSWHAKCSLPVAVRVSKTRVLKLRNTNLVPRVLGLLGQWVSARRDSGIMDLNYIFDWEKRLSQSLSGRSPADQEARGLWVRDCNNTCSLLVPLLHCFTIFGQQDAQNMRR